MDDLKQAGSRILYRSADDRCDMPCLYAIVGDRKTLMVDGGVSIGVAQSFVQAVRSRTGRGVDFAAVTHWHWDHTFGLAGVDAPVIASTNTSMHLKRMAGYDSWSDEALDARVLTGEEIFFCAKHIKKLYPGEARSMISIRQPDIVFEGELTLDLGGVTCALKPVVTSHTNDCVAVWVREEKALLIGDAMGPDFYASPVRYTANETMALFGFIRGLSPEWIFESHSEPETIREFWQENGILETAAEAVQSGCNDREVLMHLLGSACSANTPEDIEEITGHFINGL